MLKTLLQLGKICARPSYKYFPFSKCNINQGFRFVPCLPHSSSLHTSSKMCFQMSSPKCYDLCLMKSLDPKITTSLILDWKNFVQTNFLIKPYLDHEFDLEEYRDGVTRVMKRISRLLADKNFGKLQELIDPEALAEIRENYKALSDERREAIAVSDEDHIVSGIYQIGMIFRDDKIFVEIMTIFAISEKEPKWTTLPASIELLAVDGIRFANYRMIREFTKGVEDEWTLNYVNHFDFDDYVSYGMG